MSVEVFFSNHRGRDSLHIGIQGEPVPQGRPRAGRVPGSRRLVFWNPNRAHIASIRNAIRDQLTELGMNDLPVFRQQKVKVTMDFHVQRDNKDTDNMEKLVLDVLSDNLVHTDDIWVVENTISKRVATQGYSNIQVTMAD